MKKKNINKVLNILDELGYLELNNDQMIELKETLFDKLCTKDVKDTNDEMEEFKWENCVECNGYYYDENGIELLFGVNIEDYDLIDTAPTKSLIKSNIAACKLSWIIKKINEKYPKVENSGKCYIIYDCKENVFEYSYFYKSSLPALNNVKGYEILVKTNLPLIKEYFGIE